MLRLAKMAMERGWRDGRVVEVVYAEKRFACVLLGRHSVAPSVSD